MATPSGRKVAHLTTIDYSLRHLLLAQIQGSLAAGDEVIGISARGPDVPFLEEHGMRFVELPGSTRSVNLRGDLRAARNLWHILRRERPDVLHTHNPKPGIYGRVLGRLAGVPLIVHTTHGLYAAPEDSWPKRLVVYSLEALASRFSHVELVQNPEDLDLMRRWRIAPRHKLRLLGNGVDLERFRPASQTERRERRAELGFIDADVVIGTVARLVAEKGIPELIEATRLVGAPARLLLVGPFDLDKADAIDGATLDEARARGAVLTGQRDDVERLYAAMDVFCLPSHREGFPRAAMEAAAVALPIVATDIRGCRQVVEHGVNGELVPIRDPVALAASLRRVLEPETRHAAAVQSRLRAEEAFDERVIVERVLDAYASARQA